MGSEDVAVAAAATFVVAAELFVSVAAFVVAAELLVSVAAKLIAFGLGVPDAVSMVDGFIADKSNVELSKLFVGAHIRLVDAAIC